MRTVDLEKQIAELEAQVAQLNPSIVSQLWIGYPIAANPSPSRSLNQDWLQETGVQYKELFIYPHRMDKRCPLVQAPNFDGQLGGDWVLIDLGVRSIFAGGGTTGRDVRWYSQAFTSKYHSWLTGQKSRY
jgi:hypothetical protein